MRRRWCAGCTSASLSSWRDLPSEVAAEPNWPSVDILVEINRLEALTTGEPHAVLSPALLESAWAKPRNRWAYEGETDLVRLAVALMAGVALNHPFQQANKRTGFGGGLALLNMNGFDIAPGVDGLEIADAFIALIAHEVDEGAFAERLRPHVRPLD